MTTAIYFFLMATSFLIIPQLVVRALTGEPKIGREVIYLLFAFLLPLIWIFLPREILQLREVNFLQHAVGGGVATGFASIYLILALKEKFNLLQKFIFQLVFVYAMVCILGVTNELLEFFLDTVKIGIFSSDRYDTWYDLVANTSGAFVIFILYKITLGFNQK